VQMHPDEGVINRILQRLLQKLPGVNSVNPVMGCTACREMPDVVLKSTVAGTSILRTVEMVFSRYW
jgi:hypothetical protein